MVKREHYVPQFYLKRFTNDGHRLFVFDKFSQSSFESNVSDIASKNHFYDFPEHPVHDYDKEDLQIVERALGVLEGQFSDSICSFLQDIEIEKKIEDKHKINLSLFLTVQMTRTLKFRRFLVEAFKIASKELLDFAVDQYMIAHNRSDISRDDYWIDFPSETEPIYHADYIFNSEFVCSAASALCNHIWFLGLNKTTQPFYTSDNPVVTHPHKDFSGIASEGIEIAFPLTPEIILILRERTFFQAYEKLDCKSIVLGLDGIAYYNNLQVRECYRQVYCNRDSFDTAYEMCRKYPEVCNPEQPPVII